MEYTAATSLITDSIAGLAISMLAVLSAFVGVAVGYLIFKFGINRLLYDQSLEIGGYYVRNLPYRGYHRFRSKAWNMAHMP